MNLYDILYAKSISGGGGGGTSGIDMTLNGVTSNNASINNTIGIYAISTAEGVPAKHVKSVDIPDETSIDVTFDDDTVVTISIEVDGETGDKWVAGCEGGIMFGIFFDSNSAFDTNLVSIIEEYHDKFDPQG